MPIGDLIDMERDCANPECKHHRNTHGGTYYNRDCGVIHCICKEFVEVRFSRNNTTWDGLVNEANRMDNEIRVWKIRQKQTEDANRHMRGEINQLKGSGQNMANEHLATELKLNRVAKENDVLRGELAKCQEVLELLRQAGNLPPMLGDYLLGPDQSVELEDEPADDAYDGC